MVEDLHFIFSELRPEDSPVLSNPPFLRKPPPEFDHNFKQVANDELVGDGFFDDQPIWARADPVAEWCLADVKTCFTNFVRGCDTDLISRLERDLVLPVADLVEKDHLARSADTNADSLVVSRLRATLFASRDLPDDERKLTVSQALFNLANTNRTNVDVKLILHARMRSAAAAPSKSSNPYLHPAVQPISFDDDNLPKLSRMGPYYRRLLSAKRSLAAIQDAFFDPDPDGIDLFTSERLLRIYLRNRAYFFEFRYKPDRRTVPLDRDRGSGGTKGDPGRDLEASYKTFRRYCEAADQVRDRVNRNSFLGYVSLHAAELVKKRADAAELMAAFGWPANSVTTVKSHLLRFTAKFFDLQFGSAGHNKVEEYVQARIRKGTVDPNSKRSVGNAVGDCHHRMLRAMRSSGREVFRANPDAFFRLITKEKTIERKMRRLIAYAEACREREMGLKKSKGNKK